MLSERRSKGEWIGKKKEESWDEEDKEGNQKGEIEKNTIKENKERKGWMKMRGNNKCMCHKFPQLTFSPLIFHN